MEISWNTLTLVLHGYVILSLVNFVCRSRSLDVENSTMCGNSTGDCTGNSVGAARGLAVARMLFLPGRSHWYCLGPCRV